MRKNKRTLHPGVYGIIHLPSGRMYIGGSLDTTGRFTHHRFMLRRKTHKTRELQELWSRDGERAFLFVLLQHCLNTKNDVLAKEQKWHRRFKNSLNTMKSVDSTGYQHSKETRRKFSAAASRRWSKPSYRAKRQSFLDDRSENGRFQGVTR